VQLSTPAAADCAGPDRPLLAPRRPHASYLPCRRAPRRTREGWNFRVFFVLAVGRPKPSPCSPRSAALASLVAKQRASIHDVLCILASSSPSCSVLAGRDHRCHVLPSPSAKVGLAPNRRRSGQIALGEREPQPRSAGCAGPPSAGPSPARRAGISRVRRRHTLAMIWGRTQPLGKGGRGGGHQAAAQVSLVGRPTLAAKEAARVLAPRVRRSPVLEVSGMKSMSRG